jgi:hypothetical protein
MTKTSPTAVQVPDEAERARITNAVADFIGEMQLRRDKAQIAVAEQIRTELAGTWFEDKIVIPAPGEGTPHIDRSYRKLLSMTRGPAFTKSLRLFPMATRTVSPLSRRHVTDTVQRLVGINHPTASHLAPVPDWNLVFDFTAVVKDRLIEIGGHRFAAYAEVVDHAIPMNIRNLSKDGTLSLWTGVTREERVRPDEHIHAAFAVQSKVMRKFTAEVIRDINASVRRPEIQMGQLDKVFWELLEGASTENFSPTNYSSSTRLLWGMIMSTLLKDNAELLDPADPDSRHIVLDVKMIGDTVAKVFPSAAGAVAAHAAHLDPNHMYVHKAPALSLKDFYKAELSKWEKSLAPHQIAHPAEVFLLLESISDQMMLPE